MCLLSETGNKSIFGVDVEFRLNTFGLKYYLHQRSGLRHLFYCFDESNCSIKCHFYPVKPAAVPAAHMRSYYSLRFIFQMNCGSQIQNIHPSSEPPVSLFRVAGVYPSCCGDCRVHHEQSVEGQHTPMHTYRGNLEMLMNL